LLQPGFDHDVWELYDTSKDWSQARDLSKEMPDKLHQLQRLWLIEVTRYNVLPLDDRVAERLNARTRCAWSSSTPAAVSATAATSRCSSTARKPRQGRGHRRHGLLR